MSFQTTPADSIIKRVETVGRPVPHVKAKIIDGDGNVVPVGKPGELCVSGYLVQKGLVWSTLIVFQLIFAQVLGERGTNEEGNENGSG